MHFTKKVSAKYLCDLFEKALVLKGYHIQLLPTFQIILGIFLITIMIEFIQRLSLQLLACKFQSYSGYLFIINEDWVKLMYQETLKDVKKGSKTVSCIQDMIRVNILNIPLTI